MVQQKFEQFSEAVEYFASTTPEAPAAWFQGAEIIYKELNQRVTEFARALVASGVNKGDRVVVLSTPRPEFWVAALGVMRAGAIYTGINPSYTPREQAHVVTNCEPVLIFSLASNAGRSYVDEVEVLLNNSTLREAIRLDLGDGQGVLASMSDFLSRATDQILPEVSSHDPGAIVYTSGSTGAPKGALIPHFALTYGAYCDADAMLVSQPRVPCNLPTNHTGCIVDVCGATLVEGGMLAFIEKFDAGDILRLIEDLKLTNLQHVPTVLQLIALHPDFSKTDLSSLQIVAWGGAALPIEFVNIYKALGVKLLTTFGQTETVGNAAWSQLTDTAEQLANSVGHPNPDAEVLLVDEDGNEVEQGAEGEVWYRHPAIFLRYWNNPEATKKTITEDGFLKMGDVAVQNPDGTLRLVGRRSEMFKSGGLNVYPREIELVLEAHNDVALAAVFGLKNEQWGEIGAAYVVLHENAAATEDELLKWCRSNLAGYKIPKILRIEKDLPFLPIGKVDKNALRERLIQSLQ